MTFACGKGAVPQPRYLPVGFLELCSERQRARTWHRSSVPSIQVEGAKVSSLCAGAFLDTSTYFLLETSNHTAISLPTKYRAGHKQRSFSSIHRRPSSIQAEPCHRPHHPREAQPYCAPTQQRDENRPARVPPVVPKNDR